VNIEDAGFDIRDTIMWLYGSGFPKSHNIAKSVDKILGNNRKVVGISKAGVGSDSGCYELNNGKSKMKKEFELTRGTTEWEGWGTCLKPAHEPIILARKPLEGAVAVNVLKFRTGGLNIEACRVPTAKAEFTKLNENRKAEQSENGRWPANVIHDGSEEVTKNFPSTKGSTGKFTADEYNEGGTATPFTRGNFVGRNDGGSASRFFYCAKTSKVDREEGCDDLEVRQTTGGGGMNDPQGVSGAYGSVKAPSKNHHPTVKPTELMRYLVKLITPKGGKVLDPYMGSGSTGKAAMLEGFRFTGIEMEADYIKIAEARIRWHL
jgi:site-specific DNA-methyltransferase (adenine-specific)